MALIAILGLDLLLTFVGANLVMSVLTGQHSRRNPRAVLHKYEVLCPFCYVGQSRTAALWSMVIWSN